MKAVSNRKTWDDEGWKYEMRRVIEGRQYCYDYRVTKYQMHYRDGVAANLRNVRWLLQEFIKQQRSKAP